MLKEEISNIVESLQGPKQEIMIDQGPPKYFVDKGYIFCGNEVRDLHIKAGHCKIKPNRAMYNLCTCLSDCRAIHIYLINIRPPVLMLREQKEKKILRNKVTIGMEWSNVEMLSEKVSKANKGYEIEKVEALSTLKIIDHEIEYSIPITILGKKYYKVPGIETRTWYTFTKNGLTSRKVAKIIDIPYSYYFIYTINIFCNMLYHLNYCFIINCKFTHITKCRSNNRFFRY